MLLYAPRYSIENTRAPAFMNRLLTEGLQVAQIAMLRSFGRLPIGFEAYRAKSTSEAARSQTTTALAPGSG